MIKCSRCLHGVKFATTGVEDPKKLKMDMGGAVLYVMPGKNGKIEVTLNTENLIDGDYAVANWNGERWTWSIRDQ